VDAEFQRALTIVLIAGTAIVAIGTTVLFLAFRSFGKKSNLGLIAAVIAFVFICCVALLLLSYSGR
jgi:hypothetical protein